MAGADWASIAFGLGVATVAGAALGFEREWHGHDAGTRTHALESLSAAMITISARLMSDELIARGSSSDPVRVVQGLAQAIGFIAGGLIFVRGHGVHNMTTAASLWLAAAIGIAAGAGQFVLVMTGFAMALLVLTMLSLLKRWVRRSRHRRRDPDGETILPNRRGAIADDEGILRAGRKEE